MVSQNLKLNCKVFELPINHGHDLWDSALAPHIGAVPLNVLNPGLNRHWFRLASFVCLSVFGQSFQFFWTSETVD